MPNYSSVGSFSPFGMVEQCECGALVRQVAKVQHAAFHDRLDALSTGYRELYDYLEAAVEPTGGKK